MLQIMCRMLDEFALKTPNLANKFFFFKKNFSDKFRSLKNNRNIFSLESLTDYFVVEKVFYKVFSLVISIVEKIIFLKSCKVFFLKSIVEKII